MCILLNFFIRNQDRDQEYFHINESIMIKKNVSIMMNIFFKVEVCMASKIGQYFVRQQGYDKFLCIKWLSITWVCPLCKRG